MFSEALFNQNEKMIMKSKLILSIKD